ncbi:Hypothetical protein I5071_40130 [Sandaracinus amylolyticus]|nr:Hypothetical protein I5071_40130 [Sandaracinus amylolyticus]
MRVITRIVALASVLFAAGPALLVPTRAMADDDELVLMREPASFVDVIDAFDDQDPFDLNISIGYVRTWELGRIQREPGTGDARMSREWRDVADYSREVNQLVFGLDIGIFRDLALYGRLPLVLSDDRSLARIGNDDPSTVLLDRSMTPAPLFDVPAGDGFRSPTRSGLDWVSVGLAWSILNQQRDPHAPTWMLMLEGRFNIDEPMRACRRDGGDVVCQGGGSEPGISRGTNALRFETRGSWRDRYVEPYAGLAFQIEFPGNAADLFTQGGNLAGYINQRPPIQGRLTAGVAIMPWEDRQHWQRFSIDLRFMGDYVSEGRDYSPLFDALGSSTNPYLTSPACEGVTGGATCQGAGYEQVDFTGLTDTQAHARLGGQVTLELQAARYVRFGVTTAIFHSPSYGLTQADACNPNASSDDPNRVGTCRSGIINPHHRAVIDLPGQRFRIESLTQIDVAANVTAQF